MTDGFEFIVEAKRAQEANALQQQAAVAPQPVVLTPEQIAAQQAATAVQPVVVPTQPNAVVQPVAEPVAPAEPVITGVKKDVVATDTTINLDKEIDDLLKEIDDTKKENPANETTIVDNKNKDGQLALEKEEKYLTYKSKLEAQLEEAKLKITEQNIEKKQFAMENEKYVAQNSDLFDKVQTLEKDPTKQVVKDELQNFVYYFNQRDPEKSDKESLQTKRLLSEIVSVAEKVT